MYRIFFACQYPLKIQYSKCLYSTDLTVGILCDIDMASSIVTWERAESVDFETQGGPWNWLLIGTEQ